MAGESKAIRAPPLSKLGGKRIRFVLPERPLGRFVLLPLIDVLTRRRLRLQSTQGMVTGMARQDLTGVPDGGELARLANGLVIVRRKKHEPIDFDHAGDLARLTDKRNGSKFLPEWTLQGYVEWLSAAAESMAHTPQTLTISFGREVGYSNGKKVDKIRIVSDGRYVHAYPVGD